MADQSIADLCKPLSAKVMPRNKLYGTDSTERSNQEAWAKQRTSDAANMLKKLRRRKTVTGR
jgi:hypothetical protein